jgi:NADH-quinone oxidoreductase subunit N
VTLALLSGKGGGYEAAAFYAVAYTVMNLAAFGAVASFSGAEELGDVASYRGAGYSHPVTGGVLALAMLALAGIPPTAGFIGKFLIFTAALRSGETSLAIIGILTAIVSVYFYLQVVVNLYARPEGSPAALPPVPPAEAAVLCTTGLAIICLGIMPGPLIDLLAGMFP